jgi:hypothetical protein
MTEKERITLRLILGRWVERVVVRLNWLRIIFSGRLSY